MANTALNRTVAALLTNKSGGALAYGDVVILDNTNAKGFTTTTTGALSTRGIGVILEPNGIANNATGLVATAGWIPKVTLNTAATVGQFIKTHTVAGQATPHSSPQVEGTFGVALQASATPEAILFGSANGPSSSGTGDVVGPESATDNAIARYDSTTGKLIQDSAITIGDTGVIAFPDNIRQTFNPGADAAGLNVGSIAGDPGTPSNGDLWYDSSANELTARINGANVALGAGGSGLQDIILPAFTTPVDGDFAWINQETASVAVSATTGGIFLHSGTAAAATDLRIRKKSAPATPYTITAAFIPNIVYREYVDVGLVFRQSSDGKLHAFEIGVNFSLSASPTFFLGSIKFTNPNTFSAAYTLTGSLATYPAMGPVVWLRIADNGTNRLCSISYDGENFIQVHSVGRTDFLTADEVGFFININNASYAGGMTLLSWAQA